ncbi:holin [Senegalia massiliensis]|uniref:Holin n=2 Tax=Senegalia massiliensis TaxID=1720316 RepID=A0A845R3P0_9CLOT|nr:holin [Senegalia massiliensis]
MENLINIKNSIFAGIGVIGTAIATLLGGWDTALQTLIIFMAIDYLTGLVVAAVFKNSKKSKNGTINSFAGWIGLLKKGITLTIVLMATQLDLLVGTEIVRNAVIIGFITNESISIIENVGYMGIDIPDPLIKVINNLTKKGE